MFNYKRLQIVFLLSLLLISFLCAQLFAAEKIHY